MSTFTEGDVQSKNVFFVEGKHLRKINVQTGSITTMHEFKYLAPISGAPARQVHLTGANLKDGRSRLYAMVCRPKYYLTLLLYRFHYSDTSCATVKPGGTKWEEIMSTSAAKMQAVEKIMKEQGHGGGENVHFDGDLRKDKRKGLLHHPTCGAACKKKTEVDDYALNTAQTWLYSNLKKGHEGYGCDFWAQQYKGMRGKSINQPGCGGGDSRRRGNQQFPGWTSPASGKVPYMRQEYALDLIPLEALTVTQP